MVLFFVLLSFSDSILI